MSSAAQYKLSTEEKLRRLAAAVAALATEIDLRDDESAGSRQSDEPRMSAEEQVERILFVEHFAWTAVPKGGLW